MTKLSTLKPPIARLPTSVASVSPQEQTRDIRRYAAAPWRKWYGLKRWKDLRWQVLLDALFECQRCGAIEHDTSKLVADHKVPHRGRERLFWDRENLTCLCKACHDTVKQREEQAEIVGNWD
ncbi:MAG: HNH endonuclease [Shinella sp.]|uniref:HNH endonuclease n=1 Tax=Shinella sp. TaxID=1870904 RepID=UPI004036C3AF